MTEQLARDQLAQELLQRAIAGHLGQQQMELAREADHLGGVAPRLGGGFLGDVLRERGLVLRLELLRDHADDRALDRAPGREDLARLLRPTGCATDAPRFGSIVTSPSKASRENTLRMRARLTPKICRIWSSRSRVPGGSSCAAIAA